MVKRYNFGTLAVYTPDGNGHFEAYHDMTPDPGKLFHAKHYPYPERMLAELATNGWVATVMWVTPAAKVYGMYKEIIDGE